jgi:CubicO group peptidase (beta-lactamase class C family)
VPDLEDLLPDVDERFARTWREARIPGVAWGVIDGGALVHAGGLGSARDGADRRPDADTVFRIASMTKSFTAAALLVLRDEGRIGLDDPVAQHVPELATWRSITADSPPVSVRQLLTMSAGLPTDDPWGDRQQGLDLERFTELLGAGPTVVWPPGTTFDYSNLGYGILGRVITRVAGAEYRDVVRDRLLGPLGMTSTAYLVEELPTDRLAHGYVRRGEALVREGEDGYGALASMGGLFSTIRDLASWVTGFLDAFPARDDPEGPHPLRRATRREMQQVHRAAPVVADGHAFDRDATITGGGYGLGLGIRHDLDVGTIVGHAGGYPGFGSSMLWHPATGLGIVALGNRRYAPMATAASDALIALIRAEARPRRRPVPLPAIASLRAAVESLIERWDEALADRVFAMNMDLDEPRQARRTATETLAATLGPFRADDARGVSSDSPADLTWWLRGEHGWLRIAILVTPEAVPRIQQLTIDGIGDPSAELRAIAAQVLDHAARPGTPWPADLRLGSTLDADALQRELHAAGARLGALHLGSPVAGDGRLGCTFEVTAERGRATLDLALDPGDGAIARLRLRAPARSAPPEAW